MKRQILIIRGRQFEETVLSNLTGLQQGYINTLNIAIILAVGALLYVAFNIFSGFFYSRIPTDLPSQDVHSFIPDSEKRADNSNSANEVIYSPYEDRGINQAFPKYNLQHRSHDRSQQQLPTNKETSAPESQARGKHYEETAAISSLNIPNTRSSKPSHRSPRSMSQSVTDSNPTKIDPYGNFIISGQVMDETGWPVPGIEVIALVSRLFDEDEQAASHLKPGTQVQSAITNNSGFFQLQGLAEGEYKILTVASDYYPTVASIISRTGIDNVKLMVVELRKILVYGQVENTSGKPLAGVEVVPLSDPDRSVMTNQDGYYSLSIDVKRNSGYSVQFWADGYQQQTHRLSSTETQHVTEIERNIALQSDNSLVTVSGSLSSTGSAVPGERVYLKSSSTKRKFSSVADSSGKFIIPNVEVGDDYILWVSPQGPYELYRQNNVVVPADGLNNLAIALEPFGIGRLIGQMIDLNGNPIPNFSLFLRSKSSTSSHITVTGNSSGYFSAESVPKGELILETSSLPKLSVSGIELQEGTEKEVELILDFGSHQFHGQVTDSYGNPVPAASVVLHWIYRDNGITYESIHKSTSTSSGDFQFFQLGPGQRTLTVAAPGYETAKIPYEVGMSGEQTVSVQLEAKMGG